MNTYLFMGDNMTQEVLEAVKEAKEQSKPRNFTQSVDMIVNIRDLDVKKPENRFNEEVTLPNGRGKEVKIGVIADGELIVQAKKAANSVDFFIAQADMMPLVGRFLGPILGPRNKMPKPVPASIKLDPLLERLQSTVKVGIKQQPAIQIIVGSQDMSDEDLAENIETVLTVLDRHLDKGRNKIKSMFIKTTMGPIVRVI